MLRGQCWREVLNDSAPVTTGSSPGPTRTRRARSTRCWHAIELHGIALAHVLQRKRWREVLNGSAPVTTVSSPGTTR
jgi:hypothetical protein